MCGSNASGLQVVQWENTLEVPDQLQLREPPGAWRGVCKGSGSGCGGRWLDCPDSVVAVAMFFSQAGAQPRTWEASPSEHKKWVEVGVSDL